MNIAFILLILILAMPSNASYLPDWSKVKTPTQSKPYIYGSYYSGCMDGGVRIADKGDGYSTSGVHENRYYGHPLLIEYINKLGKIIYSEFSRTMIIADLASPRGGPAPINSSLHQSHQTGLDVDIWLNSARSTENPKKIKQVSMVNKRKAKIDNRYWNHDTVLILKNAASFDEVDRIFVNPVIKKELCRNHKGEKWLHKIRAWWGHSSHFHVRLKCPKGDKECISQSPIPAGDGCGKQLDWWFSEEATSKKTWKPREYPDLPEACTIIYNKK